MRFVILFSAVLMQMCLGATYSWSVYVQPLRELTGLLQGPVQIPFTVFYFVFPLTMLLAGNMLPKIGHRRSGMAGGLVFGCGWLLAGLGTKTFAFTILGIGVLGGIGAGLAYIVPIAVCIRWFPRNKGMVTGIAVAGFGGGAALVSQVGGWLMKSMELSPFQTFSVFGLLFLVTITCAASTMRVPDDGLVERKSKSQKALSLLSQLPFRLLYFAMFTGLAAGFAINANLKELYQGGGNGTEIGITAVSLFAVANGAGRIIWGVFFDRVRSGTAIQVNLIFQACILLVAPLVLHSAVGFWSIAFLTGFNYGGVLVIYVSAVTRYWGAANVGKIYGWLFSCNIPASLSPIFAGMVYDRFHNFQAALYVIAGLLFVSGFVIHRYVEQLQ